MKLTEKIKSQTLKSIYDSFETNFLFDPNEDVLVVKGKANRLVSITKHEHTMTIHTKSLEWKEECSINMEDLSNEDLLGIAEMVEKRDVVKQFTFFVHPEVVLEFKVNARSINEAERLLTEHLDRSNLQSIDINHKGDWVDYDFNTCGGEPTSVQSNIGVTQVTRQ